MLTARRTLNREVRLMSYSRYRMPTTCYWMSRLILGLFGMPTRCIGWKRLLGIPASNWELTARPEATRPPAFVLVGISKRESEFGKIDISAYYNKTTADGEETQNNAQVDIRNDWKFNDTSRWSLFGTGTAFYDRFQDFDVQVNASGGVGFRLFDAYGAELTTRAGGGASRELGGLNEDWVPEAHFGFDYDQQITKRQKLYSTLDYFPEMDGFNEFRLVTDVGWELELDKPTNMSLKLSVTDRYDSTPSDDEPRLLNYSILLLWEALEVERSSAKQ